MSSGRIPQVGDSGPSSNPSSLDCVAIAPTQAEVVPLPLDQTYVHFGDEEPALDQGAAPRNQSADRDSYARGSFIGRYEVADMLGRGGIGAVYAAHDPQLDRYVAIKLLRQGGETEESRRLLREAHALARLSHPNIVQVYDAGEHEGHVFVAMELVEGQSLRQWQKSRPHWRQVLQLYLEAAQGIAAAHDKGLIHRDIKPGNILLGKDDRVCVADFGLAVAHEPDENHRGQSGFDMDSSDSSDTLLLPFDSGPRSRLDERLTHPGTVMGTPAYMAPEQYLGTDVGPAADQYSFCLSLYEALYGALPFSVGSKRGPIVRWMERKLRGDIAEPPATTDVPAWVYRVLVRGLAVSPEERYPSMRALAAALADDPAVKLRRRLRLTGLVAMLAVLIAVAALGWFPRNPAFTPCSNLDSELATVWNDQVKKTVRVNFVETGLEYSTSAFDRVATVLDDYARAWISMRTEACEATRVHSTQPEDIMVLRMTCLNRRRSQMDAQIQVFARGPDSDVVAKAVHAAHSLPSLGACADVEALRAGIQPPKDPRVREQIETVQQQIDQLEALYRAGRYDEGVDKGKALISKVNETRNAPLQARATHWLAELHEGASKYDEAEALYRETALFASRAKDDALVAKAWSSVQRMLGFRKRRHREAMALRDVVLGLAERSGDDRLRAHALESTALVLRDKGELKKARDALEQSLTLRERALGTQHLDVAASLLHLGFTLRELGESIEAINMLERALAIYRAVLGPGNPEVAVTLNDLGLTMFQLGKYEQARDTLSRALSIREKALEPGHLDIAQGLNNLGLVLWTMGAYKQARGVLERCVAMIKKSLGPDTSYLDMPLSNLGSVFMELGQYRKAQESAEAALAIAERVFGPGHRSVAITLDVLGRILVRAGQLDRAEQHIRRALAIRETALGSTHPSLGWTLLALAELAIARGQPGAAVTSLERALTIDHAEPRAELQFRLAQALWTAGGDRARAHTLARYARDEFQRIGHQPKLDQVSSWLARHR